MSIYIITSTCLIYCDRQLDTFHMPAPLLSRTPHYVLSLSCPRCRLLTSEAFLHDLARYKDVTEHIREVGPTIQSTLRPINFGMGCPTAIRSVIHAPMLIASNF